MAQHTYFRRVQYVPSQLLPFVVDVEDSATVHYYGTATFRSSLPFSEDEMEEMGFVSVTDDSAEEEYEADALYNAEMRLY